MLWRPSTECVRKLWVRTGEPAVGITRCSAARGPRTPVKDYRINASAVLCFCCGLRAFKELAYKYRQNIPAAELPGTHTHTLSHTKEHTNTYLHTHTPIGIGGSPKDCI